MPGRSVLLGARTVPASGPETRSAAKPCRLPIPWKALRRRCLISPPSPARTARSRTRRLRARAHAAAPDRPPHRHHRLLGGRGAHRHRPDRGRFRRLDDPALVPQLDGTVTAPGEADVGVPRRPRHPDDRGRLDHDLFYAQGYVQAQDQFWEMDFRRHVTSGQCRTSASQAADRPVPADARLAPRRRAGGRRPRRHHPRLLRGLRRRGERVPRRP